MLWFLYAFLSAFGFSLRDVFSKKSLEKVDEYVASFALAVCSIPILVIAYLLHPIETVGEHFWSILLLHALFANTGLVLYMKVIKENDLSLSVPLISFTPLFVMILSPFILRELPSLLGLTGVSFIVVGSYILNLKQKGNVLAPFKALVTNSGSRTMLLVAILWGFSSIFDKIGIQNSSPIAWVGATVLMTVLLLFPIIIVRTRKYKNHWRQKKISLFLIGFLNAFVLLFQMQAVSMTLVAYVLAIKRTSTIMSSLWGYSLFKEKGIKTRLPGAIIMVLGAILIALA